MFQLIELVPEKSIAQMMSPDQGMGQLPIKPTTIIFSEPKFVLALFAGVLMAFAFQLLFTNLAIARLTAPDSPPGQASDHNHSETETWSDTARDIETNVGIKLLLSVSIALFAGSFLAVKLSLIGSSILGAITGVVIWSIFFTLLTWLGSNTLGSLLGSMISTATLGVQGLLGTGTALVNANAKNQATSTAEEITAAVRKELTGGLNPENIQTLLKNTLSAIQPSGLDLDQISKQFETLLKEADLGAIADSDVVNAVDRDTLVKLVSSRTDLSKQEIDHIVDQLESAWQKVVGQSKSGDTKDLIEQLKAASSNDLQTGKLNEQLQEVIKSASAKISPRSNLAAGALQLGTTAVLNRVLQNTNFSDLDVEKIAHQLQTLQKTFLSSNGQSNGHSNGQSDEQPSQPSNEQPNQPTHDKISGKSRKVPKQFSVIQADLENYLLFSPPWQLNRETVKREFREVIYDAAADPGIIRQELALIDRQYLVDVLSLRNDFTPEGIQELAGYLEDIRAEVFSQVELAETQSKSQNLRNRIEGYLHSTEKEQLLNPDTMGQEFQTLLEDPEAEIEVLSDRLSQFDRITLEQMLAQRQDISAEEASQIVNQLEQARDLVLSQARELQDRTQNETQELRQKVEDYLRNTSKEDLKPESIERTIRSLLDDPQAELKVLRRQLSQFDRNTLIHLLSQRQDLDEKQVNQVLNQIETVRDSILQAPQKLSEKAQEQYEQTTQAISDYLRRTNLEELNPEGIQRDLTTLLNDPKAGVAALQSRLSQIDRETLVKLLGQRNDLTEDQVNQVIDQLQSAIRALVKAPRRLANRVQQQTTTFESNLETYLRNTNREELNPDGIKRDLQRLLQDPRSGLNSLGDRVSQFDRDTFVAVLAQREDITEEDANRIADQLESSFQSVVKQLQQAKQAVQTQIEKGLGNVRNYLNSLERPELNYDSIEQDFSKLLQDPQVGLEALKNRLGQFDRDTLVAVLSSRSDISEADAERIIAQIETGRDNALCQVEQIQQETQKRLAAVQHQAQKQVYETRRVASGAAWWVFSSALASLASAAIGGFLAVSQWITL